MDPAKRVANYIADNGIDAEHHVFEDPVSTVDEAAEAAGADPSDFIKSLGVVAGEAFVVAIVAGPDRLDLDRVADLLEADDARMADPGEVQDATGYPVGGVPPLDLDVPVFVDEAVLEIERIWAGGGSDRALIQTTAEAIVEDTDAEVVRIRT